MKTSLLFIFFIIILNVELSAQSFTQAMELYRAEQFEEAAEIFSTAEDDRSQLFAGKSYLALTNYAQALHYLQSAVQSDQENIRQEALYSMALAHFGLENYDISLQNLYDLTTSDNRTGLRSDGQRLYNQILNYLSIQDRYTTLYKLQNPSIQYDLVNSSKPLMDSGAFKIMVNELKQLTGNRFTEQEIEQELLSNLTPNRTQFTYPAAPEGTVYNIGVILPAFDENDPDFVIPRNLYFGMILAADDFNERNSNQKVNLIFKNSYENADSTAAVFSELAWTQKVKAVIGPLFSEPASKMAQLSEEYQIPMIAPLANSDSLNLDYNYTFQMNPTFEIHGKRMAQFAVQKLRLDTLAIITEEGSLGRSSALAFRHEAERLGANISYYIEEDFASTGYDFSEITNVFTPDTVLIDSLNIRPSDAIYAPFTGEASTTMINLLMNNLEAMGSNVIVLGSEQWQHAPLTDFQRRIFDVYYTQSGTNNPNAESLNFFTDDYQSRFGTEPDRFSRIGYDTADFLFRNLLIAGNPDYLGNSIRNHDMYNGLAFRIFFNGHRVNQSVEIRSLSGNN